MVSVKFSVKNSPFFNFEKVLLPPLHIKLEVMKKFLKVLEKDGEDFLYLALSFQIAVMTKLIKIFSSV